MTHFPTAQLATGLLVRENYAQVGTAVRQLTLINSAALPRFSYNENGNKSLN